MFLAKVSINRPILTTMVILLFLIFGGIAFMNLNLNQMPDVEIPFVTVSTIYPGAGPKEIESQISTEIEDAVGTVSQIKRLQSYSLDGVSIVILEFELGKDVDIANQEVKDKVDQIVNELPDDAELPIVQKVNLQEFPIIDVVLSGDVSPIEMFNYADQRLKDEFSQIQGVAQVNITGGQEREINVNMDGKVVFENAISMPQLMQALDAHNMDLPGGYFDLKDQEYTVRYDGSYKTIDQIRETIVQTPFGEKKIKQFASVIDGGKKIRERAIYYNNKENFRDQNVVRLSLVKSAEGNAVEIAEQVIKILPEINKTLPSGMHLELVNDQSVFIESTVNDTISNIILGVIFTSIILLIFLYDWRSTIIVALSMPTSIISTFMLLQVFDFSLNMMSLMGLSVSVGVLVANSVVVLENIFRFKSLGHSRRDSAYKGTSEVAVAVIAATLTNIVVFVPLGLMSSMVGKFLQELAFTAAFATIISLIMSFTLTPMLASIILKKDDKLGPIGKKMDQFSKMWDKLYERTLRIALKNKFISLGIFAGSFIILILSVMTMAPQLGFEFIPETDDGKIGIEVELPVGYNLEETAVIMNEIEKRVNKYDVVTHTLTNLGRLSELDLGTNMARMDVHLLPAGERELGLQDMIANITKDVSNIPNARIEVKKLEGMGGPGAPIEFFLSGPNLDTLEKYKTIIYESTKDIPGLINYNHSSRAGKPEISLTPKRDMLSLAGLNSQTLAISVRAAIEGMAATQYKEEGEEYDLVITLTDESVDTPEEVGNIPVVSPTGAVYRISQLADVEFTSGYTKILRNDKFTSIQFTGSPAADVPMGGIIDQINDEVEKIDLPSGYRVAWGGNAEMLNAMVQDLGFAFILATLLTYMLLAAVLESFTQPILILLTLPLAIIGVLGAMIITNTTFNITSMMGIIMLIGIVVNNAILMLDYANQLRREEGLDPKEALIKACPVRLKPIIMSVVAIILGMLPMALGIGDAGKEMRIPLGVVSIGGLIVSTALTLYVVPAAYYVFSRKSLPARFSREPVG
ncbi:MAG: efflux RND transporter permease subunit [Candidatus Kapaibacterium sp.]